MAGYAREAGGPLHDLVAALGSALAQQKVGTIHGAGFGTSVETAREITGLAEALTWEATAETRCLASPIDAERAASKKGRALFLLMTDGVASSTGGSCGAMCKADAGGDVMCIAEALYEYLQAGNGLWVVGVRVPFAGEYHTVFRPGSLKVSSAQRPIYVWIGGPNARLGRATAERLVKWAVDRQPALDHIALEVWPGNWSGSRTPPPGASTWSPWSAQAATEAIVQWSTTDDTKPAAITATLEFERLWAHLLRRLEVIRSTMQ
jgi:hypothetical protein